MSVRRRARELVSQTGEAGRLIALLAVDAAARVLPRAWALYLCDAIGWVMLATPPGLLTLARMKRVFPEGDGLGIAHEWLSRPLRDHVVVRRIKIGLERPPTPIRSIGPKPRFGPDEPSMVIATGHFSREANMAFFDPELMPHMLYVVAPLDFSAWTPKGLRLRLQYGRIREAALRFRQAVKTEFVEVGSASSMVRLAKRMRQPGHSVVVSADAPWTTAARVDPYERPFGGRSKQSFALGAARLARLAQCPVVTCVPFLDENERLGLEWGEPMAPPARDDAAGDVQLTDAILTRLEQAVGERPGQYVIAIGHDRSWSASRRRWVDPGEAVETAAKEARPIQGRRRPRRERGWRTRHGASATAHQVTEKPSR